MWVSCVLGDRGLDWHFVVRAALSHGTVTIPHITNNPFLSGEAEPLVFGTGGRLFIMSEVLNNQLNLQ